MKKLIIEHSRACRECGNTELYCILYHSKEQFIKDLQEQVENLLENKNSHYIVLNDNLFYLMDFVKDNEDSQDDEDWGVFNPPDVYTIDEWFNNEMTYKLEKDEVIKNNVLKNLE